MTFEENINSTHHMNTEIIPIPASLYTPTHRGAHTVTHTLAGSSECRQCVVEPEVKRQLGALCQAVGWRSTLTPACEVGQQSEREERRLWPVTWLC